MELTGSLVSVTLDLDGAPMITFKVNEKDIVRDLIDSFRDKVLSLKIGILRKKRSLDANAYCWVLIGKIAQKTRLTKLDVYRQAIREVGVYDTICIQEEAADAFCRGWENNGLGWVTERLLSRLDGCTNVLVYYGSSTYDTAQMARLIDFLIGECQSLGIETKPQEEIQSLLSQWRSSYG